MHSMKKFCEDEGAEGLFNPQDFEIEMVSITSEYGLYLYTSKKDIRKALRYARTEWPAMKRVLENGEVEISNNISEQSVRKLKMNLKNAGNIGSENSAADNIFMYSVIESYKHNDIDPGKYISYLPGKLETVSKGQDLTGLLPCYCGL